MTWTILARVQGMSQNMVTLSTTHNTYKTAVIHLTLYLLFIVFILSSLSHQVK